MKTLGSQHGALQDTEAMLLVDDHQAELLEAHVTLDERVGADHHVHSARFHFRQLTPARRRADGARQQGDLVGRGLEQSRDVQEMLLREYLGRRHEGHLQTVLHRHERCQQRHDRLAGAHVTLQQPVHRMRPLKVLDDFLQRRLLPRGQLERQHPPRRFANPIVDVDLKRLALLGGRLPPREHAEVEEEGLFENQEALRRRGEAVQRPRSAHRRAENAPPGTRPGARGARDAFAARPEEYRADPKAGAAARRTPTCAGSSASRCRPFRRPARCDPYESSRDPPLRESRIADW